MNKRKIVAVVLLSLVLGVAHAQSSDNIIPAFKAGEKLTYVVSYKAKMWPNTDMGDVAMTVSNDSVGGAAVLRIEANATVKGMFKWFYRLDDRYKSWLRKSDMRPVKATADLQENEYHFTSVYNYDWAKMISKNRYRNHKYPNTTDTTVSLKGNAMDAISLFYNLRLHNIASYSPGETKTLAVLLKDKVKSIKYKYYGKEVKSIPGLGDVKTLKFSCQLVNDDAATFEEGSEFYVWITDDKNKVPVLLESPIKVGSIRARLVEFSGLMYPSEVI